MSVSFEMAAGLTVTYGTTLHALADRGRLKPGETSGGAGCGRWHRAGGDRDRQVDGRAGDRLRLLARQARLLPVDRRRRDDRLFEGGSEGGDQGRDSGKGADVVYDPVGGNLAEPALRALGWGGRYLVIGFASGEIPKLPLNLVLLKGCDVVGVFWGNHVEREPAGASRQHAKLVDWCAQGRIAPHIHKTYRLDETAEALGAIARREVKGKAILVGLDGRCVPLCASAWIVRCARS